MNQILKTLSQRLRGTGNPSLWIFSLVVLALSPTTTSLSAESGNPIYFKAHGERCGAYFIQLSSEFDPDTRALLDDTVWGTTAVKYRQRDMSHIVAPSSEELPPAEQYVAFQNNFSTPQIIGTYFLFPKTVTIDGLEYPGYYGTHFSIDPRFARQGYGSSLLYEAVKKSKEVSPTKVPRIDYAYVEKTNLASFHSFRKNGYESLTTFRVPTFSRAFPRLDPRVEQLHSDARTEVTALLKDFYRDHVLTDFDQSVLPDEYWVIRNSGGEIIAGVQATPRHWYLERLSGIDGWVALHILPHVPVINRQIRRNMLFLRFGNLYFREGHEIDLAALMSHVLGFHGVNTGTIYLDPRSHIYRTLHDNGLGLVNKLAGENPVELMVNPDGLLESLIERIRRHPVHISPIDH